jgi:ankyrin repeat protein
MMGVLHLMGRDAEVNTKDAKDVDFNSKDNNEWTPLWWAVLKGHMEVVRLLLDQKDIEVNSRDKEGQTLLSRSVDDGQTETLLLLLARQDVDIRKRAGRTTDLRHGALPLSVAFPEKCHGIHDREAEVSRTSGRLDDEVRAHHRLSI